jgi:O-Antigen ligase
MIGSALLAFGLVLGTASQLRLPGVPLGAGEICLVLWLGLASLQVLTGSRVRNPRALLWLGTFWVCFALILSIGACLALMRPEVLDPATILHDTFAYLLVAATSCLVAATMKSDGTLRQTQWFLIAFWNIGLVLQLALGWQFIRISSIDPWYWDRFRGWSENPNQLALYSAVLTPLSLHLVLTAKGFGRLAAVFSFLATFFVGRLTKSDTYLVAMAVSTPMFIVLRLRNWLISPEHRLSLRFAAAAFAGIAIIPLSLSLAPYAAATADDVEGLAASMMKDRGGEATKATANLRVQLWQDALHIGLESGSLGLGPGPHLEKPTGVTDKGVPLPLEAHNTLLDVFTQGGLLGVIAVVSLFAGTFVLLLRAKHDALAILIVALAIFSISHFILRHPTVWFALALSLILGSGRAPPLRARIGT